MALTIMGLTFFGFLLLGVPVAFAIGLSAICTILYEGLPVAVIFQQMMSGMNIFSFLAIPFFVFSGELMLHGGIAQKIVLARRNMVGHVRGGLGMANVVACTLFGGVAGSPVADVSAMGAGHDPDDEAGGLRRRLRGQRDHALGTGRRADADQPQHDHLRPGRGRAGVDRRPDPGRDAAGGPALVCNLGRRLLRRHQARLPGPAAARVGRDLAIRRRGRARAAGDGRHPGRHRLGIFTATESAAVAVIYSIILTFFLYRTMTWDLFMESAAKAAKTTGVVLLLIGVSTMFGYLMGLYSVADLAGEAMAGISTNPWVIFFLINLILFILGTFMDMASTILICTPIFLPIAGAYGMDPIQFGMVMLINCALGLNTPPVGTTQFIGCAIGGVTVGEVMRSILPFYTALLVGAVPGHLRAGVQPHPAAAVPAVSETARQVTVTDLETRAREALPC
jgi:hypothetical protein